MILRMYISVKPNYDECDEFDDCDENDDYDDYVHFLTP